MKFNNETLRAAVKEWLKDESKAEKKYGHISDWDTSEVTDMQYLFKDAAFFNQPLEKWDVSQVTDMFGTPFWRPPVLNPFAIVYFVSSFDI